MRIALVEHPDRAAQAAALADRVAQDLRAALERRGRATLAVPGGTTPAAFLTALAQRELDWRRVTATLTDERWVPPADARSNERLLRETLLTGPAAAIDFLPLYAQAAVPEERLAALAAAVKAHALPFDLCVLGMGADAHTASLFPGADRLAEALDPESAAILLPMRAPAAPEPRITLTLSALRSAAQIYLLIAGAEKRRALEKALADGPVTEAPVRAILRGPRPVTAHYAP